MIDKSNLLKGLFKEKNKDYTYAIIFFLVFSFFIIFAIKPSLSTALSLRQKLAELKKIDKEYEAEIKKIINLQKKIESARNDIYVLSDAIPNFVKVNKVIDDIKQSIDKNSLTLNTMNIGEVNLKENLNEKKMNIFEISLQTNGNFKNGLDFIQDIKYQRRLKAIKSLIIQRNNKVASGSANLMFNFSLESYYL